jgi:hypothetical protein
MVSKYFSSFRIGGSSQSHMIWGRGHAHPFYATEVWQVTSPEEIGGF